MKRVNPGRFNLALRSGWLHPEFPGNRVASGWLCLFNESWRVGFLVRCFAPLLAQSRCREIGDVLVGG